MITLIGYAVVIVCVVCGGFAVLKKWNRANEADGIESPLSKLSENELIKKFNGLADSLGTSKKRDLDSIANELTAVLKEYKCRKVEQFIESEQLLLKNKNHLMEEIKKLDDQILSIKKEALNLKSDHMTEDDIEAGALYMAQIAETEKLKEQLQKTFDDNDARYKTVEKQVKNFNIKYTLKETSIANMIVMAKTTKNISTVDLKLNDLISEFKDKVQDAEVEYHVRSQINGTTEEDTETSPDFEVNKDKYMEEFKNFINK